MRKSLFIFAVLALSPSVWSAQQPVTTIEVPASGSINFKTYTNSYVNPRFTATQNNFNELYTNKANISCFASAAAFNACFDLDWPTLVTRDSLGLGTGDSPSFTGVNVTSGNLSAAGYQVTKAWKSGLSYTKDITSVIHNGKHYIATDTHIADVTNEPGVGDDWEEAWKVAEGGGTEYTLPIASSETLGGVKIGQGLTIASDGTLTADDQVSGLSNVYQPLNSNLTSFASLNCSENQIPKRSALGNWQCGTDNEGAGGSGISHAASDGNYYGSMNGAWANLSLAFQAYDSNMITWPSNVSSTEVGYLDGVTSSIQNQIDNKQDKLTFGTGANNVVQLDANGALPAVSATNLTNFPTLNQNTTGSAGSLTAQYIDWNAVTGGASIANKPSIAGFATSEITGTLTISKSGTTARTVTFPDAAGTVALTSSSITGNAATATALASNPTDCGEGQYAQAIDASGNLTCAQIGYSQISGTPSIPTVSDAVYDATTWDGSTDAPTKNAVRDKIESLDLGASTATANTWQESQTHLKAITAPEYISSAGNGKVVARPYNSVAITAPPLIGAFAWLNDRYWVADGTDWISRWLLDSSMIGVSNGVQPYNARLGTVASMSGTSKYIGTNAAGEFGAHDLPSGNGSTYTLPAATSQALGGIKVGQRLSVDQDGTLSADDQTPAAATSSTLGVVRPGSGLAVDASGVLSVTLSGTVSGYVTPPPTYSDSPCTAGQYAAGSGYYYICTATNAWDRIALTNWSNPTPQAQPPTLTARAIQTNGTSLQVTGSRSLKAGTGGTGGWSMSCTTAGAVGVTYTSGLPGTTVNFGLDKTILNSDTCTLSYTNPGLGILANDDDQALASFSNAAVTNNSTQYPAPTFTSRAIHADGDKIVLTGSESLKIGAGGSGGFTLTCDDAGTVSMTYSSGAPGTTLTYGLGSTILSDDDCTLSYSGTGILSNANDTPMASFSNAVVTNNSTQSGGGGSPDYVPYEASFMFGAGDSGGENVKVCIAQTNGTLVGCSGAINRSALNNQAGVGKALITGVSALAPGDYLLGVVADGYIYYAGDPNDAGWIASLSTNSYTTPTNFSLPGTGQSDGYYCAQILNANGEVLLGIDDCTSHTGSYLSSGSGDAMTFWQFTRVTLP